MKFLRRIELSIYCMATSRAPRQSSPYYYTTQSHPDARTMMNALVSGLDISLIEPKLYGQIYDLIPNYILKFQDRHDDEVVEKMKFIQTYIEKYPERQRLEMILRKSRRAEPVKKEVYTDDELKEQIHKVVNNDPDPFYTQEQSEAIVAELKRKKQKYAEAEDFDRADAVTRITSKFIKLCEFSESNQIQTDKSAELKQKLEEAQQNHVDLKSRWRQVFDNFYQRFDNEYREMVQAQEKEIADLDAQRQGEMPAKFHKYSSELLNLKQRNKAMVYSKRYNEASEMQAEVQRLEAAEDERNYYDWMKAIDDQIFKAQSKHNQQRKIRENNFKREEKCMKETRKAELEASEKTIRNLKRAIKVTEDQIYTMEADNEEPPPTERSALPPLNLSLAAVNAPPASEPMTPTKFRQRAMLNMKVYTKRPQKAPPVTAR
ncbi:hypothetical protein TRFO_07863 [Tritrichomonas foetus]|uniref:Uncharacterized protein n=1 Tax=Tritrichomonas foetus TaxID=1144522 RepID=A0A1J4JSR8_9EUKA|nr:hypothetical protein TRFO_07863 [Tritrichomonas foetus]|eukprot:OHT00548.1 hypothetical protein TRFO_07863 [Tritrichomonas foetus]